MAMDDTRQRCLVSIGVLVVILGLLAMVTVLPWWGKMSFYGDRAEQAASRIARYERLIASAPEFDEQLQQFRRQQAAKGYLIEASDSDLAAAELQRRIKEVTVENGAKLTSTQNLPASDVDRVGRIIIRARMSGDVDALTRVLHTLEGGKPLLTIENLSIRSRQTRSRKRGVENGGYELNVNVDVIGYMQGAL